MRGTAVAVIFALLVAVTPALDEQVTIASSNLTDEAMLSGEMSGGVAVTLTGRLYGPDAEVRRPVVILLHGRTDRRAAPQTAGAST